MEETHSNRQQRNVTDRTRLDMESSITLVRDGLAKHFRNMQGYNVRTGQIHGRSYEATAEISRTYQSVDDETVGNEYRLEIKGRGNVSVRVIFDEDKEYPGRVRGTLNRTLVHPIIGSPNEVGRARELHKELLDYMGTKGIFKAAHIAKDGSPQRRYHMNE